MASLFKMMSLSTVVVIGTAAAAQAASPWSPTIDSRYDVSTRHDFAVGGCEGHACNELGCHDDSYRAPLARRDSLGWRSTDYRDSSFRSAGRFDHNSRYLDLDPYARNGSFDDGCFDRGTNATLDDWRRNAHQNTRWNDSQWDRPSTSTRYHDSNGGFHSPSRFEPWRPLNASNLDRLYR